VEAADAALLEAEERLVNPPPPDGLCARKGDLQTFFCVRQKIGAPYGQDDLDCLWDWLRASGRPRPRDHEWLRDARTRAAEVLEADRTWAGAKRAAAEACGLPAAKKRAAALHKRLGLLFRAIVAQPARTVAGVMVKCAVAAPYFADDEIADGEIATADGVLFSAARDYAALQEPPSRPER
jgi:hypothetical protein